MPVWTWTEVPLRERKFETISRGGPSLTVHFLFDISAHTNSKDKFNLTPEHLSAPCRCHCQCHSSSSAARTKWGIKMQLLRVDFWGHHLNLGFPFRICLPSTSRPFERLKGKGRGLGLRVEGRAQPWKFNLQTSTQSPRLWTWNPQPNSTCFSKAWAQSPNSQLELESLHSQP